MRLVIAALTALAASSLPVPPAVAQPVDSPPTAPAKVQPDGPELRVVQLVEGEPLRRIRPDALPSLLQEVSRVSQFNFSPDPVFIKSFADPALQRAPFCYVNFADRSDWTLAPEEVDALRGYLQRGGLLFIDAGINASFLQENASLGQRHSFAAWEVTPILREQFQRVFPGRSFQPLPRQHPFFQGFYSGLPDTEPLPEAIRDFVIDEKWPEGTYSAMALHSESGRIAVLAMPVLSMGWGRDQYGRWTTRISFRVRESAEGLTERLSEAAYAGQRYEVTREDGQVDIIYCQPANMPAWVREPDGSYRVFRYYHGEAISDYAHRFYTRLGVNLLTYALIEG